LGNPLSKASEIKIFMVFLSLGVIPQHV